MSGPGKVVVRELRFTEHAEAMIAERNIEKAWVTLTVERAQRREEPGNGTVHYLKAISERGDRTLRVIVNPQLEPPVVVTAFFDRRVKGREP